jgi:pyroglutamyl-peptidase
MSTPLPRVLLTGFDPFGGQPINPSWEAVKQLDGRRIAGHRIVARQLPTEFAASLRLLKQAARELKPVLLLGVGQAGGRRQLSIERVAINLIDARIADNAGAQPIDLPVIEGGPAAYLCQLPVKRMLQALQQAGVPADISFTAGTYVCNQIAYAMAHLAAARRGTRAGFIHIPYLPQQAALLPGGAASMALDEIVRGLEIALRVALQHHSDSQLSAGQLD